jgi:hypothetical protein
VFPLTDGQGSDGFLVFTNACMHEQVTRFALETVEISINDKETSYSAPVTTLL